ncbi:MAG: cell division protein FtsZ [Pseudomonadota bacterium]
MPLNLSVPEMSELKPRITVIGVGGAGGNAVNNMIESALEGVDFVVANTDAQALGLSKADKRIQLGAATTQGLGAGSVPDVGRAAAEESIDEILEQVNGSNMLFVTAGMGGGTGTGAAPVIASAAKERNILTVGVVTKPFHFEGARRMKIAMAGIDALQQHVDTLLIIPNQNLFSIANERTTFHEAFALADQVLHSGVRGITDLMVMPGLINLDFNDVRTVMSEMGKAMMGTGEATGDKRAIEAAEAAISNPLLDEVSMKGARGVLINITGSMDMTLFEVDEAANRIRAEVDPDANIIVGSTFNQDLEGKVRVSVVATGIDAAKEGRAGEVKSAVAAPAPRREIPAPVAATPEVNVAAEAANPVAEVHERIKRMLTETEPGAVPGAISAEAQGRDAVQRNPFRDVQGAGKGSIGAAVDMLKSIGVPKRDENDTRAPESSQPAATVKEDLFDGDDDADLEIPSFLRKKRVS